jgi:N-acetylmuramoyl-L-alanine amidase
MRPAALLALLCIAAAPLPRVEGRPGRPLVVIDAGHGGRDPGATAPDGRAVEKDVTLTLARAMRDALVRSGRVRVALTRADDRFVDLPDRPAIARRLRADLLVSVHADSAPNRAARGASIYTLSDTASDAEAARLAAKENSVAVRAPLLAQPAEIRAILADLAQRETMAGSAAFARTLQRAGTGRVRFRHRAHRSANFSVLRSGGVPAVLFEVGYLSNTADAAVLTSAAGRRAIADTARAAIETHLARIASARSAGRD